MALKYLSKFWRSLEMSLINCKVELRLKWPKHCVLAPDGTENADANYNNVILLSKTENYI